MPKIGTELETLVVETGDPKKGGEGCKAPGVFGTCHEMKKKL